MRATNRGDVPKPHVPPGQAKNAADPAEDVVFDAGSLSFVQDWVVDGGDSGGAGAGAAVDVEPAREDPRQSNPNRRLGVGAQLKKSKQERVSVTRCSCRLCRKCTACSCNTAVLYGRRLCVMTCSGRGNASHFSDPPLYFQTKVRPQNALAYLLRCRLLTNHRLACKILLFPAADHLDYIAAFTIVRPCALIRHPHAHMCAGCPWVVDQNDAIILFSHPTTQVSPYTSKYPAICQTSSQLLLCCCGSPWVGYLLDHYHHASLYRTTPPGPTAPRTAILR